MADLDVDPRTGKSVGLRPDGSEKSAVGFLGPLIRPDGRISTELSVDMEIDGETILFPTLVPTLDQEEIDFLLNMKTGDAKSIPDSIMQKAQDHALKRMRQGKSPFFGPTFK